MQRTWKKPGLIILFRGRPEERVLDSCKAPSIPSGPAKINNKCDKEQGAGKKCGACHAESGGVS